jgi:hypothetical protein
VAEVEFTRSSHNVYLNLIYCGYITNGYYPIVRGYEMYRLTQLDLLESNIVDPAPWNIVALNVCFSENLLKYDPKQTSDLLLVATFERFAGRKPISFVERPPIRWGTFNARVEVMDFTKTMNESLYITYGVNLNGKLVGAHASRAAVTQFRPGFVLTLKIDVYLSAELQERKNVYTVG